MTGQIDGILFDLGDTLLDFGQVDVTRLFQAGGKLAYQWLKQRDKPLPPFRRYLRRQLLSIRWNYLLSRLTGREFSSLKLMIRLCRRMGLDLDHDEALHLAWLWYEPLSKIASIEPGLSQTLAQLRDAGLTLGLISNTFIPGEVLDRHLAREGLLELLPRRVYSCNVGRRKPGRAIFVHALQQAGLQADRTLFVGDSLRADVKGANKAGLLSVLKDPQGRHARSQIVPRHRIARIADLKDIVKEYGR